MGPQPEPEQPPFMLNPSEDCALVTLKRTMVLWGGLVAQAAGQRQDAPATKPAVSNRAQICRTE